MRLSFAEMVAGIPGTGTRGGGGRGPPLAMNLDAVVFLRFHEMCLRFTAIATVISVGLMLPLNYTVCPPDEDPKDPPDPNRDPSCPANLTNYDRTTLANLPQRDPDAPFAGGLNARGFLAAATVWLVTYVLCRFLWHEWAQNLKLRRRYYLEEDHYRLCNEYDDVVEGMGEDEE
ncbi:hypothetical protein TeGR_g13434, partial [Tetraparma gracilis]